MIVSIIFIIIEVFWWFMSYTIYVVYLLSIEAYQRSSVSVVCGHLQCGPPVVYPVYNKSHYLF